jgi:hypothetical protein
MTKLTDLKIVGIMTLNKRFNLNNVKPKLMVLSLCYLVLEHLIVMVCLIESFRLSLEGFQQY